MKTAFLERQKLSVRRAGSLGQPVDVRVGEPLDTAGKTKADLDEVMTQVRARLTELLGDGEAG